MIGGIMRKCLWCGEDINHRHIRAKYCDKHCKNEYEKEYKRKQYAKEHKRYCKACGKDISHTNKSSYCNDDCKKNYYKEKYRKENNLYEKYDENRKCLNCGKDISDTALDTLYCCSSCGDSYNAHRNGKHRTWDEYLKDLEEQKVKNSKKRKIKKIKKKLISLLKRRLNYLMRLEIEQKKEQEKIESLTRECEVCGKLFYHPHPSTLTCSKKCRKKRENKLRKLYSNERYNENNVVDKDITLEKVFDIDDGICYLCGEPCDYDDYELTEEGYFIVGKSYPSIEHVRPVSKGGKHSWDNVRLAHHYCNTLKSDKIIAGVNSIEVLANQ